VLVLVAYVVVALLLSAVTTAAVVLCGIVLIFGLKNKISVSREKARPFLQICAACMGR